MKRISVRISTDHHRMLGAMARRAGITTDDAVEQLLSAALHIADFWPRQRSATDTTPTQMTSAQAQQIELAFGEPAAADVEAVDDGRLP